MKFIRFLTIAALFFLILAPSVAVRADDDDQSSISIPILLTRGRIDEVLHSDFIKQAGLLNADAIQKFYEARDNKSVWHGLINRSGEADFFIKTLQKSWLDGLNPNLYHLDAIGKLMDEPAPSKQAELDIILTDAFVRYVHDMTGMRINATALGMDASDWRKAYTTKRALDILNDKEDIESFLKNLPPKSQTYKLLQNALEKLASAPPKPYESVLPIDLKNRTLQPASRDKNIPSLRLRFGVKAETKDPYLYDDILAGAVIQFQEKSGLRGDGIIGATTLKLLNQTDHDRMLQIIANLERLRWVNEDRPSKFVLVNVPAATAWAIRENKISFEMPVIVGKPDRPTQEFVAQIRGVRFNPGWSVPPTIMKQDIWPKLKANPKYLESKGMALIRLDGAGGQTLDPNTVDWNKISPQELNQFEMVQIPGAHNPLGRIRILMPNRYDIYLHGTNEPEYFGRTQRAQSSGCIRMKEPDKMAAFVMQDEPGWTKDKIEQTIGIGKTYDARIKNPIPVYILYYTVWISDDGAVVYGNDIYDLDPQVIGLLKSIDGFYIPGRVMGK